MADLPPTTELEQMRFRLQALAGEKATLNLVLRLIERINPLADLDDMLRDLLLSIMDTIGGTNIKLYYWDASILHLVDFLGKRRILPEIDDPLARKVAERREFIEEVAATESAKLKEGVVPGACSWGFPLLVGQELLGVITLENLHVGSRSLGKHLPVFFHHASLIVSNELRRRNREQAEKALAESEARARTMLQTAMDGVWLVDEEGRFLEVNETACRMLGYAREDLIGRRLGDIESRESAQETRAHLQRILTTGMDLFQSVHRRKDGTHFPVEVCVTLLPEQRQMVAFVRDITERRRAMDALEEGEARLRAIFESSEDAIGVSIAGVHEVVNPAYVSMFGFEGPEQLIGTPILDLIAPESRAEILQKVQDRGKGRPVANEYEVMGQRRDGSTFRMEVHAASYELDGIVHTVVSLADITGRKLAETRLLESQARYKALFEDSPIGLWHEDFSTVKVALDALRTSGVTDFQAHFQAHPDLVAELVSKVRILEVNKASREMFGIEDPGQSATALSGFFSSESLEVFSRELAALAEGRTGFRGQVPRLDCQGRQLFFDLSLAVQPGHEQDLSRVLVSLVDVTERKRAEDALRESRATLHLVLDTMPQSVFWKGVDGRYLGCNKVFAASAGLEDPLAIVGKSDFDLPWPREEAEAYRVDDREVLATNRPKLHFEEQFQGADGVRRLVLTSKAPLRDREGRPFGVLGMLEDITERRRAEEERRDLQAQLQQAQKMESLGSLAGGVAHDMNNVLGAILGLSSANIYAQADGSPAHRAFETIINACNRGGKMVKSLLSFARQSPAEERELDLNALVREEVRLLERTTLAKVGLRMDLEEGLAPMRGDPGALAHAIMNLCVNAVDAMPEGGTLALRTRNESEGWIELEVEDSGCGMPKAVLDKALDPFFTTKEPGKGTGLGLSMVYSTVKAHQGRMEIQSEPGQGTRVKLRFPASGPVPEPGDAVEEARLDSPQTSLHVLLVDDDDLIQCSVQAILEVLGHSVSTALCGEEALASLESGLRPDVVILDMNMPGLGGKGTLPRLRELCPELPVLLATGRADEPAMGLVAAHSRVTLLSKPFSIEELQRKLEEVVSES